MPKALLLSSVGNTSSRQLLIAIFGLFMALSASAQVPKVFSAKAAGLAGLDVQLTVRASQEADEYAVVDGNADAFNGASNWIPITNSTNVGVQQEFVALGMILPESGTHKVYVAVRDTDADSISAPKFASVRVDAPKVTTGKQTAIDGLDATFTIKSTATADEYAIVDGDETLGAAIDWQPIGDTTSVGTQIEFDADVTLLPAAGNHDVYVAVRSTDLNEQSAVKKLRTKVDGPKVYSAKSTAQNGLDVELTVRVTPGAEEYAIIDGDADAFAGESIWKPIVGGTTVGKQFEFVAEGTLLAEAGTHKVYVAVRDTDLGIASDPKFATVRVDAPKVYNGKQTAIDGLDATFAVRASASADEYAIVDGDETLGAAIDWQPIGDTTAFGTQVEFEADVTLLPTAGNHSVYVAVRSTDLNIQSDTKALRTKVDGPKVYSAKSTAQNGLDVELTVRSTPGVEEYAIVDGDADVFSADLSWIPINGGATVGTQFEFVAAGTLLAEAGTHKVYVAVRDTDLGIASDPKFATVRVDAPKVYNGKQIAIDGLDATFAVRASASADEYAIVDGDETLGAAIDWQPIGDTTAFGTQVEFEADVTLLPTAGNHSVYVAVRSTDLNIQSDTKALRTKVDGPKVYSAKSTAQNGLDVELTVRSTPGVEEYAIVDGDADVFSANLSWIPINGGATVGTQFEFVANGTLLAEAGTHKVYVAVRDTDLGIASDPKFATVRVDAPKVYNGKQIAIDGLDATFAVRASASADEYAIVDGDETLGAAIDWQPIGDTTAFGTQVEFEADVTLLPTDGNHTVYVAVRSTDLNIQSDTKALRTKVDGPKVIRATAGDQDDLTFTLTIIATTSADQFAIVDGELDVNAVSWNAIQGPTLNAQGTQQTFEGQIELNPTVGLHEVQVAVRSSALGIPSAIYTVRITVKGPTVTSVRNIELDGLIAAFTVVSDGGPTEYAVMDGEWDEGELDWKALPLDTDRNGSKATFEFVTTLNQNAGVHTVYVGVRNSSLTSEPKTTNVTIRGPAITTFSPTSGGPGDVVEIRGSNFGNQGANSSVLFGETEATINSWSQTTIVAVVPLVDPGATPVAVVDDSGLASATKDFTVTAAWAGDWVGRWEMDIVGPLSAAEGEEPSFGWVIASFIAGSSGTFTGDVFPFTEMSGTATATSIYAEGEFDDDPTESFTFYAEFDPELNQLIATATITDELVADVDETMTFIFERPDEGLAGKFNGTYVVFYEPGIILSAEAEIANLLDFNAEQFGLFKFTQSGNNLTAVDLAFGDTLQGKTMGDIFVLEFEESGTDGGESFYDYFQFSGRILDVDDSDNVTHFTGVNDWEEEYGLDYYFGFDDITGERTDGNAGVRTGRRDWTLEFDTFFDSFDGTYPASISITNTTISITISDGDTNRTLTGPIAGFSDFDQAYFVAIYESGGVLIELYGLLDLIIDGDFTDGFVDGTMIYETNEVYDEGSFIGSLDIEL